MKQVVQHYGSGTLAVEEVPVPSLQPGRLLITTAASLISSGTERATVDLARRSLVGKAQARPDLVRKTLRSAATDGVSETVKLVRGRLDAKAALGYSAAGRVLEVGAGVEGWRVGDRIACAGQDLAAHAEVVCVPKNLCVAVPDTVALQDACFVAVGAIALQGIRQAAPALGETVAVVGLGLVGQLTAQMLNANGCLVLATDLDPDKCRLAEETAAARTDAEHFDALCAEATGGRGVDQVIVAASTRSDAPMALAARIVRKRGRVVIVGAVGLSLERENFYRKEVDLRFSTSYGPGRYDGGYELEGRDYPYAYVRWTEQRNMQAFLELLQRGRLDLASLVSGRVPIGEAQTAYEQLMDPQSRSLGLIIEYPQAAAAASQQRTVRLTAPVSDGALRIGVIGAGSHFQDRILPLLRDDDDVRITAVAGTDGVRTRHAAERAGAELCTTDVDELLADESLQAVFIGTRHDSHAELIVKALQAGKHVLCEKPLCLTMDELAAVRRQFQATYRDQPRLLMVAYNRSYSTHALAIGAHFAPRRNPLLMSYRVNAGALPAEHWVQDARVGGGRIIGEACHFIHFMATVADADPVAVSAAGVSRHSSGIDSDKSLGVLHFSDGSVGTLLYSADGSRELAKEYFEAHGGGRSVCLEDFAVTRLYAEGRERKLRTRPRERGFQRELQAFFRDLRDGRVDAAAFDRTCRVTLATLCWREALEQGTTHTLELP